MIGKAGQNQVRPSALGATVQSAVYGATIPVIFGRTKTALYLIWAANLRQGSGTGKKGKGLKSKKGKGAPQYAQNVDFLLGHNPILTTLQFWSDQNTKYPLNFVTYSPFIGAGTDLITIPDTEFYAVVGVTVSGSYNITFNDYGAPGPVTLSGNWETPCWNNACIGPNPTRPSSFRYSPFTYYWTPAMGNTIRVDPGSAIQFGATIYYAQLWPTGSAAYGKKQAGTAVPAAALQLTFESVLGSGPEFTGNDKTTGQPLNQQQILYPMYAGLGSPNLQMGSSTAVPDIRPEVLASHPVYPTGDAEFADMLEDIVAQGIAQAGATVEYSLDVDGNVVTGGGGSLTTPPFTKLQRGLGAYDFPGPVQMKLSGSLEAIQRPGGLYGPLFFDQPNTQGNIIVVTAATLGNSSPSACEDTAGNVYTPIFPPGLPYQAWYATSIAAAASNAISLPGLSFDFSTVIMELAGMDALDSVALGSAAAGTMQASTVTTNQSGLASYLLGISFPFFDNADPKTPFWNTLSLDPSSDGRNIVHQLLQCRTVYSPGTVSLTLTPAPTATALLAFKSTQPSPYPRSLGPLLEQNSLNAVRRQCRAFGLFGSLVMDSQQKASDWMEPLYQAMNAAPVWSGFQLKSIPKSETSYAGNGAIYNAPTANGPMYRLKESDFVEAGSDRPLITVNRNARTDVPNILQIQCPNRDSDYNDITVSQPETGSIALFSPRKDSPKQFRMIQDPAVARKVLSVMVNEKNYLLNTYQFTLKAKFKLLEQMDLITIPDPDTGLNLDALGNDISIPVRLTSIDETETLQLECEAEPFIYGCHAPLELPITSVTRSVVSTGQSPGTINTPVLFEPPPRLLSQQNQGQVWAVVSKAFVPAPTLAPIPTAGTGGSLPAGTYYVSVTYVNAAGAESLPSPESAALLVAANGSITVPSPASSLYATDYNIYITQANGARGSETKQNATPVAIGSPYSQTAAIVSGVQLPTNNYAGSLVYLSTDGGNSYNQIGEVSGSAATGTAVADWPLAADPDTTNNLLLDLTESAGELSSYQVSDEDNFVYPCYLSPGNTCIPYELMSYAVATLTSAYHYTLSATSGNHLRRAVFGCPTVGVGVDHPIGSRFAFLSPSGEGIFKITMDPLWIGQTLYFKFLPFNSFGGGTPSLGDVTAWPYTPTGVAQQANPNGTMYVQTPAKALTNPTSTSIAMAAVTVQFPSGSVQYNARAFTISAPSVPTTYYVTIADPGYLGDIGSATTRTATCQASQSLVGIAGNTYIGSIIALPAGGGTIITPGGWPPQTQLMLTP